MGANSNFVEERGEICLVWLGGLAASSSLLAAPLAWLSGLLARSQRAKPVDEKGPLGACKPACLARVKGAGGT